MNRRSLAACALGALMAAVAVVAPAGAAEDSTEAQPLCSFDDVVLPSVSGMAVSIRHKNVVWVHNSASDEPILYAVDSDSCEILARVTLDQMPGRDMEAIAAGRDEEGDPVLWVGDLGDNKQEYEFVRLYQVPEPKELVDQTVQVKAWRFAYPDGPNDAETLMADPRKPVLWVITKGLESGILYKFPKLPPLEVGEVWREPLVLEEVKETDGLISDGSISQDASRYAVRDYLTANVYAGLPPGKAITTVQLPTEPQGEAIAWARDGKSLLVAGERDGTLWTVPLPQEAWTKAGSQSASAAAEETAALEEETSDSPLSFGTLIGVIALGLLIVAGIVGTRMFRR